MPTVVYEYRSLAIDLLTLSPSQSLLEYKDREWRIKSTFLNKRE